MQNMHTCTREPEQPSQDSALLSLSLFSCCSLPLSSFSSLSPSFQFLHLKLSSPSFLSLPLFPFARPVPPPVLSLLPSVLLSLFSLPLLLTFILLLLLLLPLLLCHLPGSFFLPSSILFSRFHLPSLLFSRSSFPSLSLPPPSLCLCLCLSPSLSFSFSPLLPNLVSSRPSPSSRSRSLSFLPLSLPYPHATLLFSLALPSLRKREEEGKGEKGARAQKAGWGAFRTSLLVERGRTIGLNGREFAHRQCACWAQLFQTAGKVRQRTPASHGLRKGHTCQHASGVPFAEAPGAPAGKRRLPQTG